MSSLINSPLYQDVAKVFNPNADVSQSPLIAELKKMQQSAQSQAGQQATNQMYKSGFGRSTFTAPIAAGAATQAGAPYTQQIAQTGQNMQQQNIANFMSMLGMGQSANQFDQTMAWQKLLQQKTEDAAKRQREQSFWNSLLYGGIGAGLYALNPALGTAFGAIGATSKGGGN